VPSISEVSVNDTSHRDDPSGWDSGDCGYRGHLLSAREQVAVSDVAVTHSDITKREREGGRADSHHWREKEKELVVPVQT